MKKRCCARCCISLLFLMLFLIPCASCAAGLSCEIIPADSTWIPGESALFEGAVSADGAFSADSITMKLSIRTEPVLSEPGTILFSEVNGKKLSIRNQKDEYTVSLQESGEIRFSGSWLLPENVHLSAVEIVLTVLDPDGSIIAETSASAAEEAAVSGPSGIKFPDLTVPIRIMAIAAAVVWILAAVRILIHHKRRN